MNPKAPFAECDGCPLQDQPHVLGRGPDNPKVVIVGEAPGAQEVRTGIPFIGKSGQLLDKVLLHHGISRDEVYVTNTVLCRPPLKDRKNTPPKAKEISHCRARLIEEIKSKAPQAVLGLGAVASKTLLDTKEGISGLRIGGAKPSPILDGIPVVATFHPAAALRSPDVFPSIISDVRKLNRPNVSVEWEPPTFQTYDDSTEASYALIDQASRDRVALDVETVPPFNRRRAELACLGVAHTAKSANVYSKRVVDNGYFLETLNRLFGESKVRWQMQNGKYDVQYLWGVGVTKARVDEDTMLMHYLTDERKGTHDLQQLGTEFLHTPKWKDEAKAEEEEHEALADLPPEILHRYNATDACVTYELDEPLRADMQADGVLQPYYDLLIPGANAFAEGEFQGLHVDLDFMDSLDLELREQLKELEQKLGAWVVNPRSPNQVKAAFNEVMGGELADTTKDTLKRIVEKDPMSEAADMSRELLRYRELHKEWSTYVKGMFKFVVDGRIHSDFKLHGTETGRLSSARPNLQNIKQGRLRKMFVAEPGKVLVSLDYSQIELRVAAVLLGDQWLLEQFRSGREIHKEVARALFGDSYSDRQYRDGKAVTFGIFYDRRAPAIAGQLRIPIRKAQRMIDDWKGNVPGLEKYWQGIREQIKTYSYLESFYHRKRRFWLITNDNMLDVFREGYNFPISSAASDITLRSFIRVKEHFKDDPTVHAVVAVHDSITVECPEEKAEYVTRVVQGIMEDVQDWPIPMPVDVKVGRAWS